MDEARAIILAMTDQAIKEWADGEEEPMFPVTDKTSENPVNMLYNMAANAMAYGFWKGIEAAQKVRAEGTE